MARVWKLTLAVLIAVWVRRLARRIGPASSSAGGNQAMAKGMPQRLVCGACGKEYDPLSNGWLCPQCHK